MKRLFQSKLVRACSLVALLALALGGAGINTFAASPGPPPFVNPPGPPSFIHVCPSPPFGFARCHAIVVNNGHGGASSPSAYAPADLQYAYNLTSSSSSTGSGQTVAIVDAYDDPKAESDLGVYRSQFGLPVCTTTNGCFRKVDQNGKTKYPRADGSWSQEISLDLDMVSAICPNCHILLVEASSNRFATWRPP